MAVSCSAPKYASAQSDDGYYDNQPQPSVQDNQFDDQGASVDEQQDVDFNAFYDALSPYGTWENDPEYGEVWSSNDPSFVPYYTNGNWAYSDAGWAWVSDYSWGWAPFHYGRWAFRGHWIWVPGYEWAPAWVSWRTGDDYYGWAPLGPGISVGIGVGFGGYIAADRWNFCPRTYITSGHFNRYCIDRSRNITIIRNTTVINQVNVYHNTRYVAGPDRRDVERYTHTRINAMPIRNERRPGATVVHRGGIQMYRPNVRPGNGNRQQQHYNVPNQRHDFNQPGQNRPQGQQQRFSRPQQNNQPGQNQPPVNNTQQRRSIHNSDRQQNGFNRNNNNRLTVPDRTMAYSNNRQQQYRPQVQQQHISQQRQQYQPRFQQQNRQPQFNRPQSRDFSRQQSQQSRSRVNNNSGDRQRGGRRG